MARKTVEVSVLKDIVNDVLRTSTNEFGMTEGVRTGMIFLLEKVLFDTGNYKGYRQLMLADVPKGEKPGISVNETGLIEHTPVEVRFDKNTTDTSRREYF